MDLLKMLQRPEWKRTGNGNLKMVIDIVGNIEIDLSPSNEIIIKIHTDNSNNILLVFLTLITLACFVFPISLFFISKIEVGFGILISFFIFWGTGIYFARKILWNKWGTEVYSITDESISYYFDYGLFKDGFRVLKYKKIELAYKENDIVEIIDNGSIKNESIKCQVAFVVNNEKIIPSTIFTSLSDVMALRGALSSHIEL